MTVEKLKTAVANINAFLSESHYDDDTVTMSLNVIRSVKENYEELIEAKAEIERLENECFCLANERDAYKDVLDTSVTEAVKEFARELESAITINELAIGDTKKVIIAEIQELVREKVSDNNGKAV